MCLITKEPKGYILRKDRHVFKQTCLIICKDGKVCMQTPIMHFPISKIPSVMKAGCKFVDDGLFVRYFDNYINSHDDKVYCIENEGVHAYLHRAVKGWDRHMSIYSFDNVLKVDVIIDAVIPKEARAWRYYKNDYNYNNYAPDIASDKLILKKIIVPESSDYLDNCAFNYNKELIMTTIKGINNGSIKLLDNKKISSSCVW